MKEEILIVRQILHDASDLIRAIIFEDKSYIESDLNNIIMSAEFLKNNINIE